MLNKCITIAVVALMLLQPSVAFARQWVVLSDSPLVSVDVDSIKGEGDTRTFWDEIVYNEERYRRGYRYRSQKSLTFVDCERNKIGSLRTILYKSDGEPVEDFDFRHLAMPPALDSPVPDSIGEAELLYVCSLRTSARRVSSSDISPRSTAPSKTITKQQAINLINKWLKAKHQIFAPPYSQRLIEELTAGNFYNELMSSNGPVSWLKNNDAYYQYGVQKIDSVWMFATSTNGKAIIELRITEDRTLYHKGKVEPSQTGLKTDRYRYNLELSDGQWKIADYRAVS